MNFLNDKIAPGEGKKLAGLIGAMGIASIFMNRRRNELDKKDAEKFNVEVRKRSIWEHPFIAYLIENGSIVGLVFFAQCFPIDSSVKNLDSRSPLLSPRVNQIRRFLGFTMQSMLLVDGAIMLQEFFLVNRLYRNIPWFSTGRPTPTNLVQFFDWIQCNFPATLINALLQTLLITYATTRDEYAHIISGKGEPKLKIFPFLVKLAIARVMVDLTFYFFHKQMHNRSIYKVLHARHHEHYKCVVPTNLHFTWPDLFLEGTAPLWVANIAVAATGQRATSLELKLIASYIVWFEIASHSGKEIPYATMFPPLTPLLNAITDIDRDNIKYHETHHNLVKANYGITQWIDKLMGSHRLLDQPCDRGENTDEETSTVKEIEVE